MPSETRFRQISSNMGTLMALAAGNPSPADLKALARAVQDLAELCAEQQREIDELKRMGQSGGRRFT